MRKQCLVSYQGIISINNLLSAWEEFVVGKKLKSDVRHFSRNLIDNILQLHTDLANFTYKHGGYKAFNISDPKPRNIHKAQVRDRILHHAIYRVLYPFFDKTFISDSYSCRLGKGVHKAINQFRNFGLKVSSNNTRTVWVLKMDIKKFFANIDHKILIEVLASYGPDKKVLWLLQEVISSFSAMPGKGLPLGNLTSQLFCNVYMNKFDQFVKHNLKSRYYIRYADDFVLFSDNKQWLQDNILEISNFLQCELSLKLHPDKIVSKTLASGVDFLGWVHFPHHRVLRMTTKKRAVKRVREHSQNETLQSYLGLISHGNAFNFEKELLNWYGLWQDDA